MSDCNRLCRYCYVSLEDCPRRNMFNGENYLMSAEELEKKLESFKDSVQEATNPSAEETPL